MKASKDGVYCESKDIPPPYLDGFVRLLLENLRQEVLARPKLSKTERKMFESEVQTFRDHFKNILAIKDTMQRQSALRGLWSALSLGYYHAGGPKVLRELTREFQNERTRHAREARQLKNIREIIDQRARTFWGSNPSFKGNKLGTARNIYTNVTTDILTLGNVPRCWAVHSGNDANEYERYLDNIRKYVPSK